MHNVLEFIAGIGTVILFYIAIYFTFFFASLGWFKGKSNVNQVVQVNWNTKQEDK
jgi:hypothetical protein